MLSGIQWPKKWRFKTEFDVDSNCMQDLHGVIFQESECQFQYRITNYCFLIVCPFKTFYGLINLIC